MKGVSGSALLAEARHDVADEAVNAGLPGDTDGGATSKVNGDGASCGRGHRDAEVRVVW